jgi:hypothetical protein
VDRFAPFLLLVLLLLLVASSGCATLPTPGTAQAPPSGSLVVSFIDVGQGDGVLVQSGGESYLLDAALPQQLHARDSGKPGRRGQLLRPPHTPDARTPPEGGRPGLPQRRVRGVIVTIDGEKADVAVTKGA